MTDEVSRKNTKNAKKEMIKTIKKILANFAPLRELQYSFWLSFLFFIFLISCKQKSVETPGHIMEKKELVNLQVDLYMVEAAHNMNVLKQDSADSEYKILFETILKKHNVTRDDYESSLRYYAIDNESLNEIYDSVMVKLTKLENEVTYTKDQ